MIDRRSFNNAERRFVFFRFSGQCCNCNERLRFNGKWEVDHITPYSKGGETTLKNAQLLCWRCNREKSNSMIKNKWDTPLRDWQTRAFLLFQEMYEKYKLAPEPSRRSILINAFPGSGKTTFAMRIIYDWLSRSFDNGKEPFVIWVTPKKGLTHQTNRSAGKSGIKLSANFNLKKRHRGYKKGVDGLVMTYSLTDYHVDFLKSCAEQYNLLVIMDECHHVAGLHPVKGTLRAWGDSTQSAFEHAAFFVLLTGTSWRSDSHQISFARYNRLSDNTLQIATDFDYTYRDALADTLKAKKLHEKIAREITFVTMGGDVDFMYGDEEHQLPLTPDLERELTSPALRSALSPTAGNWFRDWFLYADEQLVKIRNSDNNPYPNAAGLVIASSVEHMEAYADIIEKQTGERPLTVSYMEEDPEGIIEDFKNKPAENPRWILSVQMISEGVDIPRLSVLLYCTNVRQKLFFFQAIGRVIRWDALGSKQQQARVYIPFVNPLVAFAQEIKDMQDSVIRLIEGPGPGPGPQMKMLAPFLNEHAFGDVLRTQNDDYAESRYVELAQQMLNGNDNNIPNYREELAFIIKQAEAQGLININSVDVNEKAREQDSGIEVWDEFKIDAKKTELDKKVKSFAYSLSGVTPSEARWQIAKGMTDNYIHQLAGIQEREQCGQAELDIMFRAVSELISGNIPDDFANKYRYATRYAQ